MGVDTKPKVEVKGVKKYDDPNYKDPEEKTTPSLTAKEVVNKEPVVKVGNTVVKPIRFEYLSEANQKLVKESGKGWITRNSQCPCGSGKRFKSCCLEELRDTPSE